MTSVTRTLNKMNGKQALPEDGALQKQRGRYKSANTVFAKRAARGWLDCLRHSPRPKHLHQGALSTLSLPAPFARNASCHRTSEGFRVIGGTSLVHLDPSLKFVNGVNGVKGVNVILERPPRGGPAVLGLLCAASCMLPALPASSALCLLAVQLPQSPWSASSALSSSILANFACFVSFISFAIRAS